MRKSHPSRVTGVTTYDRRVYAFAKPVNPAATNARDQRHLISDQVMFPKTVENISKAHLMNFMRELISFHVITLFIIYTYFRFETNKLMPNRHHVNLLHHLHLVPATKLVA